MKKYVKPMMDGEVFVSNEYVAACYMIKCQTPEGNSSFTKLVNDTNGNGTYDSGDQTVYSSMFGFSGCGKWHKGVIRDSAPTANGFVVRGSGKNEKAYPVFWWKEDLGGHTVEYHSMILGKENYQKDPNAS